MDFFDNFVLCNVVDCGVEIAVKMFSVIFVFRKDSRTKSVISVDVNLGRTLANHGKQAVAHVGGAGFSKSKT